MLFPLCVCVNIASGPVPFAYHFYSSAEVKSLVDDRVRTGMCTLLSNLCCYELLSISGFLRFDLYINIMHVSCLTSS